MTQDSNIATATPVAAAASPAPKRFAFMDVLNVVAICAVVLLHVSLNAFHNQGDAAWDVALVYQCVAIFAVPIFFMVSGANLLGYRERYSTVTFFRKRAVRVVVTLVVWSIIMYLLLCFCSGAFGYEPRRFSPVHFVAELLTCNVINIYWFFYVIIGLYLVTPIFSLIAANKQVLGYTILLAIALTFIVPTAVALVPRASMLVDPYRLDFFTWSLTYFLLGYYLTHYVDRRFNTAALIAVCVACVVVTLGATYVLNAGNFGMGEGSYNTLFAKAESVTTIVYATALFLLFKQAEPRLGAWKGYPVWKKLSALSLGVYACHLPFVWIFDTNVLALAAPNSALALALQFILEPLLVYGLSLCVAWLEERIKAALKRARK